jgi:chromosome segregation ATPase
MKYFQQNLLIALAFALCGLCAWQWHFQTVQRGWLADKNREISRNDTAIQGYTNSLDRMSQQITRMDQTIAGLNDDLRQALRTNGEWIILQKREIARLGASNDTLLTDVAQYTNAVAALQSNLDTAYDGIKKQNAALEQLAAQRDEFIQKYTNMVSQYNDTVTQYNGLVGKYTNVVNRLNDLQTATNNSRKK